MPPILTRFDPKEHGFHFANRFVNTIVALPGGDKVTTYGRCGGMAYTVLDFFRADQPVPPFTETEFAGFGGVPPDGHPLASYIYKRQLESFATFSALKFFEWSLTPDGPTFFRRGVTRWTREDEFPKLRRSIDNGIPVPLGLIFADEVSELAHNHQVVAYGYEFDPATEKIEILIYDVNWPDLPVRLVSEKGDPHFHETSPGNELWRGWFVQDFAPRLPPPDLADTTGLAVPGARGLPANPVAPKAKVTRQFAVSFSKVTILHDESQDFDDALWLEFDVAGETDRWPARGTKTVAHGKTYRLNKRYVVEVAEDAALSVFVNGVDEDNGVRSMGQPGFDNDQQAGIVSRRYTAADNWGVGAHEERSGGGPGGYIISYQIEALQRGSR